MRIENYGLLIPLLGLIGGFSIAILAIVTNHIRKRRMIEKGIVPPIEDPTCSSAFGLLQRGIIFLCVALGLGLATIFDRYNIIGGGIIFYFVGVSLFVGLGFIITSVLKQNEDRKDRTPQ